MKRFSGYNLCLEATHPFQNAANQSWAWRLQFYWVTFFNFILNLKNFMILWILPWRSHDLPYKSHMTHDYCAISLIFGYLKPMILLTRGFWSWKLRYKHVVPTLGIDLDLTLNLAKVKGQLEVTGQLHLKYIDSNIQKETWAWLRFLLWQRGKKTLFH